jgi:hypothetical protein
MRTTHAEEKAQLNLSAAKTMRYGARQITLNQEIALVIAMTWIVTITKYVDHAFRNSS